MVLNLENESDSDDDFQVTKPCKTSENFIKKTETNNKDGIEKCKTRSPNVNHRWGWAKVSVTEAQNRVRKLSKSHKWNSENTNKSNPNSNDIKNKSIEKDESSNGTNESHQRKILASACNFPSTVFSKVWLY